MGLFKNKNELPHLTPANTEASATVLETIERLQLDPDETMVVGSAALALYGAILSNYDPLTGESKPRPGDVDFASTASYMDHLYQNGTPTGLEAVIKPVVNRQTILRVETGALPADVITRYDERHSMERYDARFRKVIAERSRRIEGTGMRIADYELIERELRSNAKFDQKAASDLAALRQTGQK